MEKMGYAAPDIEQNASDKAEEKEVKKSEPRVNENRQEKEFTRHGGMGETDRNIDKPSVRKRIEDIKTQKAKNVSEKEKDVKNQSEDKREKSKGKDKGIKYEI